MKLFKENVKYSETVSDYNTLQVEDFKEIFFETFEIKINGKEYLVEQVGTLGEFPIVLLEVSANGQSYSYPFVLKKGKFNVSFNVENVEIPDVDAQLIEESASILPEVLRNKNEILDELERDRIYAENQLAIFHTESKKDVDLFFKEKEDHLEEIVEGYERRLRENVEEVNEQIQKSIDRLEKNITEKYVAKLNKLEERIQSLSLLDEAERKANEYILEKPSLMPEQHKLITERLNAYEKKTSKHFQDQIASMRRMISVYSGGGSVATQYQNGGTMNGNLLVTGTLSAGQFLGLPQTTGAYLPLSGGNLTGPVSSNSSAFFTSISTNRLDALSANITVIDIRQYELSGFNVKGDAFVEGNIKVAGELSAVKVVADILSGRELDLVGTAYANSGEFNNSLISYGTLETYNTNTFNNRAQFLSSVNIVGFLSANSVSFNALSVSNLSAASLSATRAKFGMATTLGNLGVATETPNEKLTVVGNISATGNAYLSALNILDVFSFGTFPNSGKMYHDTTALILSADANSASVTDRIRFKVRNNGGVGTLYYSFDSAGRMLTNNGSLRVVIGADTTPAQVAAFTTTGWQAPNNLQFAWSADGNAAGTPDAGLSRLSANTIKPTTGVIGGDGSIVIGPNGVLGIGSNTVPSQKLTVVGSISSTGSIQVSAYKSADGSTGASGSFTTVDGKTVTVKNGIITSIV